MSNADIASIFFEMADILEMKNIQWKPRAYRQAARAIDSLRRDVKDIYKQGGLKLIEEIPGVGEGIGKKIVEYLKTGKVKDHDRLLKTVPSHMGVLMKIPALGPKKIKKLNQILKISTVAQLKSACLSHKISKLPGFGDKSEQDILEGIDLMRSAKGKIPYKQAKMIANKIITQLKGLKEVSKIEAAGSLRRKKVMIRDIDILVSSNNPKKVIDAFTKIKEIKKVLAKGPTKAMVILKSGTQSDLRVLKPESWGAGLFYFTGSKNYNIEMRKIAIKKGFKLSEYGLFEKKTNKMAAGRTEKEICQKLGVKYLDPSQRER